MAPVSRAAGSRTVDKSLGRVDLKGFFNLIEGEGLWSQNVFGRNFSLGKVVEALAHEPLAPEPVAAREPRGRGGRGARGPPAVPPPEVERAQGAPVGPVVAPPRALRRVREAGLRRDVVLQLASTVGLGPVRAVLPVGVARQEAPRRLGRVGPVARARGRVGQRVAPEAPRRVLVGVRRETVRLVLGLRVRPAVHVSEGDGPGRLAALPVILLVDVDAPGARGVDAEEAHRVPPAHQVQAEGDRGAVGGGLAARSHPRRARCPREATPPARRPRVPVTPDEHRGAAPGRPAPPNLRHAKRRIVPSARPPCECQGPCGDSRLKVRSHSQPLAAWPLRGPPKTSMNLSTSVKSKSHHTPTGTNRHLPRS